MMIANTFQTHTLGPPVIGIGYNLADGGAAKAKEQKNRE